MINIFALGPDFRLNVMNLPRKKILLELLKQIFISAFTYSMCFMCLRIPVHILSLKRHRCHKKAIIAISRLLLTSAYHILLTGKVFDYNRFENLINRNLKSHKNIQNTPEKKISY